jgi:pimeloyl-ACP methyl ester carboxylesterase
MPTLVISGNLDGEEPRANYEWAAKGIPGARIAHVPGAAHLVNVDQPQEFLRIVMEFLQSL